MPSQFMADWVRSHFGERLTLAWKTVLPIVRDVRVIAAADAPRPAPLLILEETPAPAERDPTRPISTRATASRPSSSARPTKSRRPPRGPWRPLDVGFNPLFIHGGTGRGKTHLLHAIGHAFTAHNRGARVVSMSAEKVHGRVHRALKENDTIGSSSAFGMPTCC
jgi:chromosomal replication initiator protein